MFKRIHLIRKNIRIALLIMNVVAKTNDQIDFFYVLLDKNYENSAQGKFLP